MVSKDAVHNGEPRNVAFDEKNAPYFSTKRDEKLSYVRSDSGTIFSGSDQVDLFLTCMALAKFANKEPLELKKREANIPTNVMRLGGRWLILALGIANRKNITCLNDESELYKDAEKYSNAGFDVLKSLMEYHGAGFAGYLEIELMKIANEMIESEKKKDLINE